MGNAYSREFKRCFLIVKQAAAPLSRRGGSLGQKPFGSESLSYDVFETSGLMFPLLFVHN